MSKLITKNDIWRYVGVFMIVFGGAQAKEMFNIFGQSLYTNMTQFTGFVLLFLPHILRYMSMQKESKSNTDLPQA